ECGLHAMEILTKSGARERPLRAIDPSAHALQKSSLTPWCERGDSNPHGLPRQLLRLVRLPIPPLSRCGFAARKVVGRLGIRRTPPCGCSPRPEPIAGPSAESISI